MSYDLSMKPAEGQVTCEAFLSYFGHREHYSVDGNVAIYLNDDTGVHFSFTYQPPEDPALHVSSDVEDDERYPISFYINYCRPSYFIREAEPEVHQLVEHFDLLVDDPQANDLGATQYNPREFISCWHEGNAGSYKIIACEAPDTATLPSAVQQKIWDWNYHLHVLQNTLADDIFVPHIMTGILHEKLITYLVWADGIPTLFPEVDVIVCYRKRLAPRALFRSIQDIAVCSWQDVLPLLEKYKLKMLHSAYYLFYSQVPTDIELAIRKLPTLKTGLKSIAPSEVLDRELLDLHLGQTPT